MKILIICGSRRDISLTRKITDIAYEYAKGKYPDVAYLDLGKTDVEPFRGYIKDVQYSKETLEIVKMVESSDVYIVGSPAYDGTMSAGLKNLFEYVDYKEIGGRPVGIIVKGASPGAWQQVRSHIVAMMHYFGLICNPRAVFAQDSDYDEKRELTSETVKERTRRLVDETAGMARKS